MSHSNHFDLDGIDYGDVETSTCVIHSSRQYTE
jgi:hypothetical protein